MNSQRSSMPNFNNTQSAGSGSWMSNNMNYVAYFCVTVIFAGLAYYIYKQMSSSSEVYSINRENGESASDNEKTAELMLFYVDWCPHCKTAKPEWDELKSEYENKTINGFRVIFTEINCTEETMEVENKINKYKIEGYPTVKLLKDGQIIDYDAKPTKKTMEEFLNTVL